MASKLTIVFGAFIALCSLCAWEFMSTTKELSPILHRIQRDTQDQNRSNSFDTHELINVETPGGRTETTLNQSRSNLPRSADLNGTIVVHLRGEMGNHVSVIIKGHALKSIAAEKYGINAKIVLRHADGQWPQKWKAARKDIQQCFPNLQQYNFTAANTKEFSKLDTEQGHQLKALKISALDDGHILLDDALSSWKRLLQKPGVLNASRVDEVSAPFFSVKGFADWKIIEQRFDEIKRLLTFDKTACCRDLPDPDESVFHFRNFLREFPRSGGMNGKKKGFEELSPNKTAHELFAHLNAGDKVAITTRFLDKHVRQYVSALEKRGMKVRVVTGQSGVQDFCFLLSAKKELMGTYKSTFVRWAAILGDMDRVELYDLRYPMRESFDRYPNFTDVRLKNRLAVKTYNSEAQDEAEAQ